MKIKLFNTNIVIGYNKEADIDGTKIYDSNFNVGITYPANIVDLDSDFAAGDYVLILECEPNDPGGTYKVMASGSITTSGLNVGTGQTIKLFTFNNTSLENRLFVNFSLTSAQIETLTDKQVIMIRSAQPESGHMYLRGNAKLYKLNS